MARPSPRTLGVTTDDEGETVYFTKFGTQQLVKDPTSPTGVRQLNTGQNFKMFTTAPVRAFKETFGFSPFGSPTPRDEFYPPMTITKGVGTTTPPAFPKGNGDGAPGAPQEPVLECPYRQGHHRPGHQCVAWPGRHAEGLRG